MERVWLARSRARQHADAVCKRRAWTILKLTGRPLLVLVSHENTRTIESGFFTHRQLIYFRRAVTPEGGVVAMVVPGHRPARHWDTIVVRAWGKARSEANALAIWHLSCTLFVWTLWPHSQHTLFSLGMRSGTHPVNVVRDLSVL